MAEQSPFLPPLMQHPEAYSENGRITSSIPAASLASQQRLIKLISVRLKEAALDSPSFRATVNYCTSQVDHTDQWIDSLIKFSKKYPQQLSDFREFNSVLVNQLLPDFLGTGLVDEEKTAEILTKAKSDLTTLWVDSVTQLDYEYTYTTEILSNLSKVQLKRFKEIKKSFEFMQSKYDSLLSKYNSQSKYKEPSALREDAFQLYEVRKSYLASSLDMCLEISKVHDVLNSNLIQLTELLFKGKSSYDKEYFAKVAEWSDAVSKSVTSLLDDMNRSKDQIEAVTIADFEPSRDLKQHNPALINPSTLINYDREIDGEVEDQAFEKHGWLWMKTTVGKPSRTIWVRRWVFVKSGIFGLFCLSPSKRYVQETDKIGVLLCNIRYAPDEDRRFCFEIKTIDLTITFQAETLKELRAWLKVFTLEKQRAIENSINDSEKFAFGRYPPLLYEFANTSLTSVDSELTSTRYDNRTTDEKQLIIASSHLAELMKTDGSFVDDSNLLSDTQTTNLCTPITTSRSKVALLSHEFLTPTVVPTAVNANIWGSVNWGLYYLSGTAESTKHEHEWLKENQKSYPSLNTSVTYADDYPAELKKQDTELRSLFDAAIDPNELLVLTFSCLWSLNPHQELSGRCFVTNQRIYFYLNSAGFVSLLKRSLSAIVSVEVVPEKNWDVLKVYDIDGLNMRGRIFLEDTKLIQKKFQYLINDLAQEKPSSIGNILAKMASIEAEHKKKETAQTEGKNDEKNSNVLQQRFELNSVQPYEGQLLGDKFMRTNYKDEYEDVTISSFNVPAKALFHLIYGDNSSVMRDSLVFLEVEQYLPTPWYNDKGELVRYIDLKVGFANDLSVLRTNMPTRTEQRIEEMIENKYYRIRETRNSFQFFWRGVHTISRRIVIIEQDSKSCKMFFYVRMQDSQTTRSVIYKLFKSSILKFQLSEIKLTISNLKIMCESLGQHGKIIKAIRTYGNLSKTDEPFVPKESFIFKFKKRTVLRYYLKVSLFQLSNFILTTLRFGMIILVKTAEFLSTNKLILFFLGLSIFFNLYLGGKTSVSFWNAVRTENLLKKVQKNVDLNKVERAITLDELDLLSTAQLNTSAQCFTNYIENQGEGSDKDSLIVNTKFKDSIHQVAVKRNELLVELKILEKIEKELTIGGYKNFLLSELNSCRIALEELQVDDDSLKSYCSSCSEELQKVSSGLL